LVSIRPGPHLAIRQGFNADLELHNAATSDAVVSGINWNDAICLTLTGRTGKSDAEAISSEIAVHTARAPVANGLGRQGRTLL
jgi:hypothetical protein